MGTCKSMDNSTVIQYKLTEEVHGKHQRFAAQNTRGDPISIEEWIHLLFNNNPSSDSLVIDFTNFIRQASSSYEAFFFETKGTSVDTKTTKQFEFVLVNAVNLRRFVQSRSPAVRAFSDHFDYEDGSTAASFKSLGGSSVLVCPKPQPSNSNDIYTDIATFIRNAPEHEIVGLWKLALGEYRKWLEYEEGNVWFSTSGLGIPWLHLRLDPKPKYYSFEPFARES